jgi:hypothetical protein
MMPHEKLTALLEDKRLTDDERDVFSDMQSWLEGRGRGPAGVRRLSRRQITYIERKFDVLELGADEALNLVSSGLVPRGREVPVPEALRVLPKKPPGRQ